MGEMQFSILNSHYQQHKWAGPIYNTYHSPSRASHPSYLPWEPYPMNNETHSFSEKRYNTLESVLLGEIPASYSHLTTTSPHLSSSPSATSSCSSSSSSSPCASSDGSYSASPHPNSSSPAPLNLQNEIIQPAAAGLSDYQSEPMDLSCKTPVDPKCVNGDNICYTDDRSFLNGAASYSYHLHHDNSVTDCTLMSPHAGGQTFMSSENYEQPQQCSSPVRQVMHPHSPEQQQHSHLQCHQALLSNRHSPVQQLQCESPMQQPSHQPHQESPVHYQVSSESARHQTFPCVTPQEMSIQQREPNPSCRSPMQFSTQSSPRCSGNSRHSVSPPSSTLHLHQTPASTPLESTQSLYEAHSVQIKPQSIHRSEGNSSTSSSSSSSSVDPHESNRPVQINHNVSSQFSKTAGHSLLRDLLSCGRNNKSQENGRSSLSSENSYSFSSSLSSSLSEDDSVLSCPPKPKEEYVGSKDYSLCSTTRVTLAKKNLLPISARVTEWLYKMVKFAKEIPQFVKLPNNDRLTLILNSWTRLLLMHMAENNFQFAVTPLHFSPNHKTDEAPASNEPTMKSVESVQSFIRKCQGMNLDTSEFEYLRMLVLFNAGYVGLEMPSVVDSMNSRIQQHLQQHIHTKHPRDHIRFSRVLMCLPSLYGINCKMIDNLFCGFIHGKTDIEVLLKDMLQDL